MLNDDFFSRLFPSIWLRYYIYQVLCYYPIVNDTDDYTSSTIKYPKQIEYQLDQFKFKLEHLETMGPGVFSFRQKQY